MTIRAIGPLLCGGLLVFAATTGIFVKAVKAEQKAETTAPKTGSATQGAKSRIGGATPGGGRLGTTTRGTGGRLGTTREIRPTATGGSR